MTTPHPPDDRSSSKDDALTRLIEQGLRAATDEVAQLPTATLALRLQQRRGPDTTAEPRPIDEDPVPATGRAPQTRRLATAAAAVLVALLAGGVWFGIRSDDTAHVATDANGEPEETGSGADAEGAFAGWEPGWHEIDPGPVPPMAKDAVLAWHDQRLVVAGTTDDGPAVFAFDPTDRSWDELPEPPFPVSQLAGADETLVAVGSNDPPIASDVPVEARWATLSPEATTWEDRGALPAMAGLAEFGAQTLAGPRATLVWTGERLVHGGYGAVLDPTTGDTDTLPAPEGGIVGMSHLVQATPVWTGTHLALTAWADAPGLAWNAELDDLVELPTPTDAPGTDWAEVQTAALGNEVVLVASVPGAATGRVAALDPDTATWRSLPDVPLPSEATCPYRVATVGEQLLVQECAHQRVGGDIVRLTPEGWVDVDPPGQDNCCQWLGTDDALITWVTSTDTWADAEAPFRRGAVWIPGAPDAEVRQVAPPVPDPQDPPDHLLASGAVAWTGQEVVVLTGSEVEDLNGKPRGPVVGAAYDPAAQRWRTIAGAPLELTGPVLHATMTDEGVVAATDRQVARWDPSSDAWQPLPDAPGPVDDLTWTGEMLVSHSANAVLEPGATSWTRLPEPPLAFERVTVAGTGVRLVVIGGQGQFGPTRAMALEVATRTWVELPDPPEGPGWSTAAASFDGERVVVLDYGGAVAAYDPATNTWDALPPVPAALGQFHPQLVTTAGTTVATFRQTAAVFDGDRWIPRPARVLPVGDTVTLDGPWQGSVAVWGTGGWREPDLRLRLVDLASLAEVPEIQVGGFVVVLERADQLLEFEAVPGGWAETLAVSVAGDQGECRVASAFRYDPEQTTELEQRDGVLDNGAPWFRDETGRRWEALARDHELVRIECDDPTDARRLTEAVRTR